LFRRLADFAKPAPLVRRAPGPCVREATPAVRPCREPVDAFRGRTCHHDEFRRLPDAQPRWSEYEGWPPAGVGAGPRLAAFLRKTREANRRPRPGYRRGYEFSPDGPGATWVTEDVSDCSRFPAGLRTAVPGRPRGGRAAMTASLARGGNFPGQGRKAQAANQVGPPRRHHRPFHGAHTAP